MWLVKFDWCRHVHSKNSKVKVILIFKFLSMNWVSILIFFLISKIDTKIHTQKINFLFFIFNHLFRNLQEIRKILKLKLKTQILKKFKTQTQT